MTLWTVAPLGIRFSWQEYLSGLPFHPPGDLPNPRIEPTSPASPALAGKFFTTGALGISTNIEASNSTNALSPASIGQGSGRG